MTRLEFYTLVTNGHENFYMYGGLGYFTVKVNGFMPFVKLKAKGKPTAIRNLDTIPDEWFAGIIADKKETPTPYVRVDDDPDLPY